MRTVLVTGATDGIGKQVSLELLNLDYKVILHGRNPMKMGKVVKELKKNTNGGELDTAIADFSSFDSVREMAKDIRGRYSSLDVLFNNAGLFSWERKITVDGNETTFQVNYLSPFLLTAELFDLVAKSDYGRIVNVSSGIHAGSIDFDNLQSEKRFERMETYCMTKLCNLLFTYKLAREQDQVNVNALHPGYINTNINPNDSGGAAVTQGSISSIFLITSPDMNGKSGFYANQYGKLKESKPVSYDIDIQDRLWNLSEQMVGRKFFRI